MKHLIFFLLTLCIWSLSAQHQEKVDFVVGNVDIHVNPIEETISGKVVYKFKTLQKVDTIFLDAHNMQNVEVLLNKRKVKVNNTSKKLVIHKTLKANKTYTLSIKYRVQPKQTVYFLGWKDNVKANEQIWTQGQGKYTSYWLPSFDDMNEKLVFNLTIHAEKEYEVIANGVLRETKEYDSLKKWKFSMKKPMSSYLLAFAVGNYQKKEIISDSGVPIKLYYYPKDSVLVEPTYRYTNTIFNFLEKEIGVPYPWQNYKQIPVRDFLYAGMENTGTTIFSDSFMIDSIAFKDKNYVNVNAHEMAHQWFGNLVTEVDGSSHWLHEGFATYYALLAEKKIFGEEYYYWKLFDSAKKLQELSNKTGGEALHNPKASSLTFYEKGAWALHMLKRQIGETKFKLGMQQYLSNYAYKNASIEDFLKEMERVAHSDLTVFRKKWLTDKEFPFDEAKQILIAESKDVNAFFALQKELMTSSLENEIIIKKYLKNTHSNLLKVKIITTYYSSLSTAFIKELMGVNNVVIRQAIAISASKITVDLKPEFESLLNDESYVTKAEMLYKLWLNFPADRASYLGKTKGVIGFSDKNFRLLWISLSLLTKDFEPQNTNAYYAELSGYTASIYANEVRQTAFQFLNQLIGLSDQNLLDLIQATQYHSWQFKKYARALLDQLLEKKEYKSRIDALKVKLNTDELRYINKKLITE